MEDITGIQNIQNKYSSATLNINDAAFYHCLSTTNDGGALYYSNDAGVVDINSTIIQSCTSYLKGGGIYVVCNRIEIKLTSFVLCSATLYQAAYISSDYVSTDYGVCIYRCSDFTDPHFSPVLQIEFLNTNWDEMYLRYLNMSYNSVRTQGYTGMLSLNALFDFAMMYMEFLTLMENECGSEIQLTSGFEYDIYRSNFVRNHLEHSVFYALEGAYGYISECCIGYDYSVPNLPEPTVAPTPSSIFETYIPVPTPPSFNLSFDFLMPLNHQMLPIRTNLPNGLKYFFQPPMTNHYDNQKRISFYQRNGYRKINPKSNILLAIVDDSLASLFFIDCKIGHTNDNDNVFCDDQCYIYSFTTIDFEAFYPETITQSSQRSTEEIVKEFDFPTQSSSIALISICIIVIVFVLVVVLIKGCSNRSNSQALLDDTDSTLLDENTKIKNGIIIKPNG